MRRLELEVEGVKVVVDWEIQPELLELDLVPAGFENSIPFRVKLVSPSNVELAEKLGPYEVGMPKIVAALEEKLIEPMLRGTGSA